MQALERLGKLLSEVGAPWPASPAVGFLIQALVFGLVGALRV